HRPDPTSFPTRRSSDLADRPELGREVDGERDLDRDLGLLRGVRDEDHEPVIDPRGQRRRPEIQGDELARTDLDDADIGRLAHPRSEEHTSELQSLAYLV